MSHGANYSDIRILLQGENVFVVLEEHDALRIKLSGYLLVFFGVDVFEDVFVRNASKRLLKESQCKFRAEHAGNGGIQDVLTQFARFDQVRNRLEAIISTTHLDIVASRQSL